MNSKTSIVVTALALAIAGATRTEGQAPAGRGPGQGPTPAAPGGGRAGGSGAGPQRPAIDAASLERGQGLYSVNCASCHGSEARGGETGSNLLRSAVILDDQAGELLLPVVRAGRPERGMPPRPEPILPRTR